VHFLFRNRQGINQPIWFDEGFAQFASTIEVGDESMWVGRVPAEHVRQLRNRMWLSPNQIFPLRDLGALGPAQRDVFPAQSWALVHLLLLDQADPARARNDAQRYLEEVDKGMPPTRAFESAFGVTGEELLRRLGDVVRRKGFRTAVLRARAMPSPLEPRPLAADDVLTRLGWLSIWVDKPDQAARYFHMAGSVNARNARARAGLASAERLREHWDEANAHYAAALAGAPSDAIVQLEAAHFYRQRAEAASDPESRADLAARARLHYQRSIDVSPRVAEPHAGVGATYLIRGERSAQSADPLERARELQPSSLEIELLRAESAVARGNPRLGRRRALNVASRTHSRELTHAACGLVHRIDRCRLASVEVDPIDSEGPGPGAGSDDSGRNLCGLARPEQREPCD
jgi:tetratricopeptide (TPR) repeat protein